MGRKSKVVDWNTWKQVFARTAKYCSKNKQAFGGYHACMSQKLKAVYNALKAGRSLESALAEAGVTL